MQNSPTLNSDFAGLEMILRLPVHSTATLTQVEMGSPVIGQYFDQDFVGSSGDILNNFVESGQVWALLIGIVLGYLIRGMTAY